MKGVLEFNLPEEERDFHQASRAAMMAQVIGEIDSYLRNHLKYGPAQNITSADDLAQWLRSEYTVPALNQIDPNA